MKRAEWLAQLQTFDKAWLVDEGPYGGRVIGLIVMGDGRVLNQAEHVDYARDLRGVIVPVPDAPWGHCPGCGKAYGLPPVGSALDCLPCAYKNAAPRVCPGSCRTQEEHDSAVLEQRRRCGLAAPEGVVPS